MRDRETARVVAACLGAAAAWAALSAVSVSPARAQAAGVYEEFSRFCTAHFGAKDEPEAYRAFGQDVKAVPGSLWTHFSETSACIAWQTNLPAKASVEYGPTTGYGRKTAEDERATSLHVQYLRGLKPETTYHWRWVAVDEKGKRAVGPDATFRTRRLPGAVRIPGDVPGPPYVLDKADATYLLTRDISADGTGVFIAASGITLDLGGHTVTYDGKRDPGSEGACGIRGHKRRGIGLEKVTVVNGLVRRGAGGSETRKVWDTLYMPLFFSRPAQLALAGLTVRYHGCQVVGLAWVTRGRTVDVHHNVLRDEGTALFNRHVGMDAIAFGAGASKCHHNLILRTRHRGLTVQSDNEADHNEIYVDSHATNSYGIMYYAGRSGGQGLALHHNRIFGTGYHPVGIGSGQGYSNVKVHANYIQMQGTSDRGRWRGGQGGGDPAGQMHPVNGIRLQRCGRDIAYYDNVIVVKGSGEGCWMRGLWLVPGEASGPGLVFRNNRVKLIAQDARAEGYAVSAGGAAGAVPRQSVRLGGNTVLSNLCHVQFGDNYSHGGRYDFAANTFVKVGRDPRYRTIRLGWRGWKYGSWGHVFTDTRFEGGAGYDSVSFDGAARGRYDFAVQWSLTVKTRGAATVSVRDSTGAEVYSARAGPDGRLVAPLAEYVRTSEGRSARTPHTVTVRKDGKTVTRKVSMTRPQTIEVALPGR